MRTIFYESLVWDKWHSCAHATPLILVLILSVSIQDHVSNGTWPVNYGAHIAVSYLTSLCAPKETFNFPAYTDQMWSLIWSDEFCFICLLLGNSSKDSHHLHVGIFQHKNVLHEMFYTCLLALIIANYIPLSQQNKSINLTTYGIECHIWKIRLEREISTTNGIHGTINKRF
jgi:hypothetical protein